jgi:hypothetical protein
MKTHNAPQARKSKLAYPDYTHKIGTSKGVYLLQLQAAIYLFAQRTVAMATKSEAILAHQQIDIRKQSNQLDQRYRSAEEVDGNKNRAQR